MAVIIERAMGLDKITSTDISRQYSKVSKIVKNTVKPLEITKNGKADIVVMNPEMFMGILELLEDYQDKIAIMEYQSNKENIEFISTDEAFKDVDSGEYSKMSIDELLNQ